MGQRNVSAPGSNHRIGILTVIGVNRKADKVENHAGKDTEYGGEYLGFEAGFPVFGGENLLNGGLIAASTAYRPNYRLPEQDEKEQG